MTRPRSKLAPRTYHEVAADMESAVRYGYQRAHKHTDEPSEEQVVDAVTNEVMGVLADVVLWPRVRR